MLIADGTLILAVDGGRMSLMRYDRDKPRCKLELVKEREIANPRDSEQGTDAPGRSYNSMGGGGSAHEGGQWHDRKEAEFATQCLEEALAYDNDSKLVLVTPPHMLGILRDKIGKAEKARIIAEIDKDYADLTPEELAERLEIA